MTGRTCQLCGKPLSRFSIGSGGDFCSREHRNQFRLRLGMDRLQEANKVASLMRRRENAKAIPPATLARDSKVLPRSAPVLRVPLRPDALHLPGPPAAQFDVPKIASMAGAVAPRRHAAAMSGAGRAFEASQPFRKISPRPLLRVRSERFPAGIPPAGALAPLRAGARVPVSQRKPGELATPEHRAASLQVRRPQLVPRDQPEPQRARRLTNSADRGRDLRVSGGIGFRLPQQRLRVMPFSGPQMVPPARAAQLEPITPISRPPAVRARLAEIRLTIRNFLHPPSPQPQTALEFRFPGAIVNRGRHARQGALNRRPGELRFAAPAPSTPALRTRNGVVRFLLPADSTPVAALPPAHSIASARRLTLVDFHPRETPFEMSPTALHGTLVSGMHFGSAPVRRPGSAAPAAIEEHFDSGLQNWLGGIDDWKVDVAGVRPGSLALFSPSLDLHDYQLEFLARIETHGLSWIFRASSFEDYYQATILAAPEGGFEFRRSAVLAGVPQTPIVQPITVVLPGRNAVTVRTRVCGNDFTVSLDGRVIDTWNDSRLVSGGIGFVSAPEDRARLYWVKVTPAGYPSKEHPKS